MSLFTILQLKHLISPRPPKYARQHSMHIKWSLSQHLMAILVGWEMHMEHTQSFGHIRTFVYIQF